MGSRKERVPRKGDPTLRTQVENRGEEDLTGNVQAGEKTPYKGVTASKQEASLETREELHEGGAAIDTMPETTTTLPHSQCPLHRGHAD